MTYMLKLFNTGQVTLPMSWRKKFKTKFFFAKDTKQGLLIKPVVENNQEVIEYENDKEMGLFFPSGIDPQVLIDQIKSRYGKD